MPTDIVLNDKDVAVQGLLNVTDSATVQGNLLVLKETILAADVYVSADLHLKDALNFGKHQTPRNATISGSLRVDGNVGVGGVETPQRPLQVKGAEIHSEGSGAGFSFSDRKVGAFVDGPTKGERWVWYADEGTARLWSGRDVLTLTTGGELRLNKLKASSLDVTSLDVASLDVSDLDVSRSISVQKKAPPAPGAPAPAPAVSVNITNDSIYFARLNPEGRTAYQPSMEITEGAIRVRVPGRGTEPATVLDLVKELQTLREEVRALQGRVAAQEAAP